MKEENENQKMNGMLVFQSDFGLSDGAVAAMYGVALCVDENLRIYNLTHDIPPFDTFEASYRLLQAVPFWPAGTIFVSVVEPGVGSQRRCIVAKSAKGQFIVTPDNGTLSHLARAIGIESARIIREDIGRREGSQWSATFHGRDIFAYSAALLAGGKVTYDEIGEAVDPSQLVMMEGMYPEFTEGEIRGTIETLDVRFGSLWTNISSEFFEKLHVLPGEDVDVSVYKGKTRVYHSFVPFGKTFSDVEVGEPLLYVNSMHHIGVAINQGNFAGAYNIGTRDPWRVVFKKKN